MCTSFGSRSEYGPARDMVVHKVTLDGLMRSYMYPLDMGVARILTWLRTSKRTTETISGYHQNFASLFINGTSLKGKNLLPTLSSTL